MGEPLKRSVDFCHTPYARKKNSARGRHRDRFADADSLRSRHTFYPEPRPEDYCLSAETNALAHGSASGQVKFEQEQGRKGDELAAAEGAVRTTAFCRGMDLANH